MMPRSQWCSNKTCNHGCALADLCTVHRGEPTADYPGRWILYHAGQELYRSKDYANTFDFAVRIGARKGELDGATICWDASDGDPRVGQGWFTGFYQEGRWNQFGQYVTA
jgi:hypothetical protein